MLIPQELQLSLHCVTIRMRENYAKKNPGKIEEIKRILDSFTIKGER